MKMLNAQGYLLGAPKCRMGRCVTFVSHFENRIDIEFDPFQEEAIEAILRDESVLVAAPTGSGKTLVGVFGACRALDLGLRTFYTTPLKALSNQKYAEFVHAFGVENVGLLTGDNSINPGAPVVVMTTEVLRNMIYANIESLGDLGLVVLDEVHYLQNPYRGSVWEEVIIHLPRSVRLVCLSATVSNVSDFAAWMREVRGQMTVVEARGRPVPLDHRYLYADRRSRQVLALPVLQGGRPNPKGSELDPPWLASTRRSFGPKARGVGRPELIEFLAANRELPAIIFIFSRAGCQAAAEETLASGLRLTTPVERGLVREVVDRRLAKLDPRDLKVLGFSEFLAGLEAGFAPHHAGLIPPFREIVEECFERLLIKVVFATETLSLGINMPARSVVIEKMVKFNGETHKILSPGEYTQFSGRAGRRGIDSRGTSYVAWGGGVAFADVARVVEGEFYPITSSFRPTYNMAANLVKRYTPEAARELLNLSFAQFSQDAEVVRLEAELRGLRRQRRPDPSLGTVDEVHVVPGSVISVPGGDGSRHRASLVVLSVAKRGHGQMKIQTVSPAGRGYTLGATHLREARMQKRITLPQIERGRKELLRREAAKELKRSLKARHHVEPSRDFLETGHSRDVELRQEGRVARLQERISQRRAALSGYFERVLSVMEAFGFSKGWSLTPTGAVLANIYAESDILVALALDSLALEELDEPSFAAVLSWMTFEPRPSFTGVGLRSTHRPLIDRFVELEQLSTQLQRLEGARELPLTRMPDVGFSELVYDWADQRPLERILRSSPIPPGDFVRNTKQIADLARQVAAVYPEGPLGRLARRTEASIVRGIVALSSEVTVPGDQVGQFGGESDVDVVGL
jgi:ATP-dependent RNA helicase HelY